MRTSTPRSNYKPQLDGLRAIAVLLVFLHHWTQLGFDLGIIGVQLFFVLSGFLITGILLDLRQSVDNGTQTVGFSLRQFYVRRFLRIFPLYYFCVLFFVFLDRFGIRETIVWHSLFLSNVLFFVRGAFYGPFSHFWTLAVEEQFYVFWPWVVLLVPIRFLPRALVFLILLSPIVRSALFFGGHVKFAEHSTLVFANFDTLGLGALAASFARDVKVLKDRFQKWLCFLAPIGGVEIVVARVMPVAWIGAWLDSLAVAVVSVWAVWNAAQGFGGIAGKILTHRTTTYLGRISYGLYVWHMFAPAFVRNVLAVLKLPSWLNWGFPGFCLSFLFTLMAALATWHFLERPINDLKKRFPYRKPFAADDRGLMNATTLS